MQILPLALDAFVTACIDGDGRLLLITWRIDKSKRERSEIATKPLGRGGRRLFFVAAMLTILSDCSMQRAVTRSARWL